MKRSPPTWFGFTLTQKQAISLFVLALFGFLICVFVFVMSFTSIFMNYYYYSIEDYFFMDDSYITVMLISQLPITIFFFVIFLICCYTLSRCRKTARYYNQHNNYPQTQNQTRTYPPRAPQIKTHEMKSSYNEVKFCPNCGTKHGESHQFCTNCGYELI